MGLLDTLKKDIQEGETNVEETPQTPPVAETTQVKPTVDRSAYNCPTCKGEGLVVDTFEEGGFVRCPQCQGTGKV